MRKRLSGTDQESLSRNLRRTLFLTEVSLSHNASDDDDDIPDRFTDATAYQPAPPWQMRGLMIFKFVL